MRPLAGKSIAFHGDPHPQRVGVGPDGVSAGGDSPDLVAVDIADHVAAALPGEGQVRPIIGGEAAPFGRVARPRAVPDFGIELAVLDAQAVPVPAGGLADDPWSMSALVSLTHTARVSSSPGLRRSLWDLDGVVTPSKSAARLIWPLTPALGQRSPVHVPSCPLPVASSKLVAPPPGLSKGRPGAAAARGRPGTALICSALRARR